jgi:hypothetical protein
MLTGLTAGCEWGIVCQKVDDVKTSESRRALHIDSEMLNVLKLWKQTTQFSENEDWMFASPIQIGHLPWSYVRSGACTRKQALRPESAHPALLEKMVSAEGIESTIKRSFNDMQTADDTRKQWKTSWRMQTERKRSAK